MVAIHYHVIKESVYVILYIKVEQVFNARTRVEPLSLAAGGVMNDTVFSSNTSRLRNTNCYICIRMTRIKQALSHIPVQDVMDALFCQ